MAHESDRVAEFIELRSAADRMPRVCARATHYYDQGLTVSIWTNTADDGAEIDDALWTFRQQAFVPHVRSDRAAAPVIEPVVVLWGDPLEFESDAVVVAGGGEPADWHLSFRRVCDFAPVYDEELRAAARRRYCALQAAGYRMRFVRH
jgi:DNA polymerase-3 subunit chi